MGEGVRRHPHRATRRNTDPVEYVKSVTGGNGADVCIEAIGNPAVYRQAFDARDLAGTVVLVGVPRPDMTLELPFIEVFGRGGALKSSWYGDCLPSRDFPMLVDLTSKAACPRPLRQRDDLARRRSRRRSTRWSVARCCAASSCCEPARRSVQ